MVRQLADAGVVELADDEVALSDLGSALAAMIALSNDDDDDNDDLDLVDTDAQSLLLVCVAEMQDGDARASLLAWCGARPAHDAVAELCEAMLDDDDPEVWDLGFQALGMVDRAVAEPAVRRLRRHPGMGPLAGAWLRGRGSTPSPAAPE